MVGFESGDTVERILNSCVMRHHTGPAPSIMVWGGIGYHSRTPLVRIAGTLSVGASCSTLPLGLVTAMFQ
ncbi:hypothetical protein TNCV_870481 [Trichonephila clavipes]|nr:hypothetical protein TNCV_870481 [Trichonephila clavipes]